MAYYGPQGGATGPPYNPNVQQQYQYGAAAQQQGFQQQQYTHQQQQYIPAQQQQQQASIQPQTQPQTHGTYVYDGTQAQSTGEVYVPPATNAAATTNDVEALEEDNEHVRENVPFYASAVELGKKFGLGIQLYFNFCLFIALCNAVQLLIALPSYIYHVSGGGYAAGKGILNVLLVASYGSHVYGFWLATSIISILAWFAFAPWYWFRVKALFKKLKEVDHEEEDMYGSSEDEIKENRRVSRNSQRTRVFLAYIVFILLMTGFGAACYFINLYLRNYKGSSNWRAILLSFLVYMMKFGWKPIVRALTAFEKHFTWSTFRKHETIKLFFFKMGMVVALDAGKGFSDTSSLNTSCVLEDIGLQYFWLLIMEITLSNAIEMGTPIIKTIIMKRKALKSETGSEAMRPDFDVAEEYLELLYRQFIVYMGTSVFPLITLLALVANLLEYVLDKYRLLRICQRPPRLKGSMKSFLTLFLLVIAVLAVVAPPVSPAWLLSFRHVDAPKCSLFANVK